jgi:Fe-S-cluster containining protein
VIVDRCLQQHAELLKRLDEWFRSLQSRHGYQMRCAKGCARCCCGLFDISLPDALHVAEGFSLLSEERKSMVAAAAAAIQQQMILNCPQLKEPFFLHDLSENTVDRLVERIGDVRCPLLDERNGCLIYDYRPLACRLEGVPMVDAHDGRFGDWCDLNFTRGLTRELAEEFRLDYYQIQETESDATRRLSSCFLDKPQEAITLFIPSVIVASRIFRKLSLRVADSSSRIDRVSASGGYQ